MSRLLIGNYLNELDKIKKVSGCDRETVVREAFKDLLKHWGRSEYLTFIPEFGIITKTKEHRRVDGALLYALRVPLGYWEAKDTDDDLNTEIENKFRIGYPKSNIIFEDTHDAVLIQNGEEVFRCLVDNVTELEKLLKLFFSYERPEIAEFHKAVEQFQIDLPEVLKSLRTMIEGAIEKTPSFRAASEVFLKHIQEAINPSLTDADVREMLIQHILTSEVFMAVFPNTNYHEDNSVAQELHKLEETFFTGNTKFQTLKGLEPYYAAIRKAASQIETHSEKQSFLKVVYERFYKIYNPKAADRLGVVYTPNEIVRFIINGADWLCEKHFNRNLIDSNVEILDPAAGTGTFICELLEHFRGQPEKLKYKYKEEIHANEVAILPYYVANLNIEATYAAITGNYEEFPNLCFVDTLDNTFALRKYSGQQGDLFGSLSDDNIKRIRRQNDKRISVIIGNPPYNANQLNENDNNKNRKYPEIDKRIKATYIKESTAQKTKVYDPYARFFRWASDRLDENGIIAFVTNRSFIESKTFDGFRSIAEKEFNEIRIVDLGGDVHSNPKLSGTKHNVFGIQTGVAISFMVRKAKTSGCKIYYSRRPEYESSDDKLYFLDKEHLMNISCDTIKPDKENNWLNQSDNDFDTLIPIASKSAKYEKNTNYQRAIFSLYSLGAVTNRDDWAWDHGASNLQNKINYFINCYENERLRWIKEGCPVSTSGWVNRNIKWTSELEDHLRKGTKLRFDNKHIIKAQYRPYVALMTYYDHVITHRIYKQDTIFPIDYNFNNVCIVITDPTAQKPWLICAVNRLPDLHFVGAAAGTLCFPLWNIQNNTPLYNVTDWALDLFQNNYKQHKTPITKKNIFNYTYAVLHDPIYRNKYAINLKRNIPRIPLYKDFNTWSNWGKTLMDLHINYENVSPFPIQRINVPDEKAQSSGLPPRTILKSNKSAGSITIDSETTLSGIPSTAWEYQLGTRSAIDWILDQYKEKKPKDPTVREKFNTYRFADYKESVIDLLSRIVTLSIETVKIIEQMRNTPR